MPASYRYYFCIEHSSYSSVRCIFCTNRLDLSAKREEANYTTISLGSFTSNIQGRQMRDPLKVREKSRGEIFLEREAEDRGVEAGGHSVTVHDPTRSLLYAGYSCGC